MMQRLSGFPDGFQSLAISVVFAIVLSNRSLAADPFTASDQFAQRLREPHTGMVDGQSFRVAIRLAASDPTRPNWHLNTWLDRKVNPNTPVSPSSFGPTRYASLVSIAESVGCVCYPVDNCVLIGRPAWVAALARVLCGDHDSASSRSLSPGALHARSEHATIDLQWPELTTPSKALEFIRARSPAAVFGPVDPVPHDLWPQQTLRDISPQTARLLVLGQFANVDDSSQADLPWTRLYQFPGGRELAESLRRIDRQLSLRTIRGKIELTATPPVHQAFCAEVLSKPPLDRSPEGTSPDHATDTDDAYLRLKSNPRTFLFSADKKPAGALIKALLAQIGIECEWDEKANPQLRKLVTIPATNETVSHLVGLIAEQASLKILPAGAKIRVSIDTTTND